MFSDKYYVFGIFLSGLGRKHQYLTHAMMEVFLLLKAYNEGIIIESTSLIFLVHRCMNICATKDIENW
jgi:hypothetical protein